MKIEFTKDWCMKMAALEGNAAIVAGSCAQALQPNLENAVAQSPAVAFGKLVQLLRRDRRLSIAELAIKVDLDLADLKGIEQNPAYKTEPRSVYKLAEFFDVPRKMLLKLSGLTAANDESLISEALRFAASSDPSAELSKEEKAALRNFIAFLNEKQ